MFLFLFQDHQVDCPLKNPGKPFDLAATRVGYLLTTLAGEIAHSRQWLRETATLKTLGRGAISEQTHRYPQISMCVGVATRGGTI